VALIKYNPESSSPSGGKDQLPDAGLFVNGVVVYFVAFRRHIGMYLPVKGDESGTRRCSLIEGRRGI
jgi:hypothetical protein